MENRRIESREEVAAFLARLKYALEHGATIMFQKERRIDEARDVRYTNQFTVAKLFQREDEKKALRRELGSLEPRNYLGTVCDTRFPHRPEMREFGVMYPNDGSFEEVYIKIRTEIMQMSGEGHFVFVMSFHFAEKPFSEMEFPYQNGG